MLEVLGVEPVVRPAPGEGCDYRLCGSIAELRTYLRPAYQDRAPFGADFESNGLNTLIAQPCGISLSTGDKSGLYVPIGHLVEPELNLPVHEVLRAVQDADDAGAMSHWFGVLFDLELAEQALRWTPKHWLDVIYGVFLVDSNELTLGLKDSSLRFLGRKMQEIQELDEDWIRLSRAAQKRTQFKLPHMLSPVKVTPYACEDASHTLLIGQHKLVQAAMREQAAILDLETRLSPVMRRGNRHGVVLDVERLVELEAEANDKLAILEPEIYASLGQTFNLNRKGFLATIIKQLVPEIVETTKRGADTASTKVLEKYKNRHKAIPLLIQRAQLVAQRDNYIVKLRKANDYFRQFEWAKGRVRFAFNHIGVPTGRMKCGGGGKGKEAYLKGVADVNAQSIPDHEKAPHLPNTRSAFVAPPGFVVVAIDYSQIEVRIPTNLCREPAWVRTYQDPDGDIHLTNAKVITAVKEPGVVVTKDDKARRGAAKAPLFALLYGGDEHTVARNANIPLADAKAIMDAFKTGLPVLMRWLDGLIAHARSHKQIATFMGRVRRLAQYYPPMPPRTAPPGAYKAWMKLTARGDREAVNHPVQGGAADIFKAACIFLQRAIDERGWGEDIISPQILWVHDEVLFYVREEWVTRVVPVLVKAMEFPIKGWVIPIKAEPEVGDRRLYYEKQRERAARENRHDDVLAWSARIETITGDHTGRNSSWGELVAYDAWVKAHASAPGVAA